jgi:hypothetical protein
MPNELSAESRTDQPVVYQIRIQGHLGPQWTDWFEGLTISLEEGSHTLLTGVVIDQAALHGLLKKCEIWECRCSRSIVLFPIGQILRVYA